jgi:hypothetical protein
MLVDSAVESTRSANMIVRRRISPWSAGAESRPSASTFPRSMASTCSARVCAVVRSPRLMASKARSSSSSIDARRSPSASPCCTGPSSRTSISCHRRTLGARNHDGPVASPPRVGESPLLITRAVAGGERFKPNTARMAGSTREPGPHLPLFRCRDACRLAAMRGGVVVAGGAVVAQQARNPASTSMHTR